MTEDRSETGKEAPLSSGKKGSLEALVYFFSEGNKGISGRLTRAYETMIKGYEIINEGYRVILKGTQDLSRFYLESAQRLAQESKTLLRRLSPEASREYAQARAYA